MSIGSIRVVVHHGDAVVRAGLIAIVRGRREFELVAAGGAGSEVKAGDADVVIADYVLGLECVAGSRDSVNAAPKVLILTVRESEWEIRRALESGVQGYLTLGCDLDELLFAVRALHRGLRHLGTVAARRMADSIASQSLTAREMDVLRLVVDGLSNKGIAARLQISAGTVKTHMKEIFQKLGAATRTEVATVAERRGLLGRLSTPAEPGPLDLATGARASSFRPSGAGGRQHAVGGPA